MEIICSGIFCMLSILMTNSMIVISNLTEIPWPSNSPDLNPLDFFFWGHSMNHVFQAKPSTMDDLKKVVDEFGESMDPNLVRKVCSSARGRFKKMKQVKGGHFVHLYKK